MFHLCFMVVSCETLRLAGSMPDLGFLAGEAPVESGPADSKELGGSGTVSS